MTRKKVKSALFRTIVLFTLLITTTSCEPVAQMLSIVVLHISSLFNSDKDVTSEEKLQHIAGKIFILKQDVFYFEWIDTKQRGLDTAGRFSALPSSIEAYERDPYNWMNTDRWALESNGKSRYFRNKVIGIIRAGTRIKIEKIINVHKVAVSNRYKFIAKILDGEFKGISVPVTDLFWDTYPWATPYFDKELLTLQD